jgi:hypothetical protein
MQSACRVIHGLGLLLVGLLLVGCATVEPLRITRAASGRAPEVYDCALREVSGLGYILENANKDSGFFKATRSYVPAFPSPYWPTTLVDEMTVLITEDPVSKRPVRPAVATLVGTRG